MDDRDFSVNTATELAKKPNELERLFGAQAETRELISILEARLTVVSHPQPQEAGQQLRDSAPHISSTVDNQRHINNQLRYILDTLVV